MKTFVITGATGFIGGHLANDLLKEWDPNGYSHHRVVTLVRDGDPPIGSEIVRGELEDLRTCERLIAEYEPDGVFHLAAQAIVGVGNRDPLGTLESNVRGTYNLLEAFRRHRKSDAKMVVASSDKAYGELPEDRDSYDEWMPLEGRGIYDVSKTCTDLITQSYGLTYSLPIAIIRAGNVYGPGDDEPSRIIPSLCQDVLNRRPLTIRSDGTPIREYLHVRDVVLGYRAAYEHHDPKTVQAYNLGTGDARSVRNMAEVFLAMLKRVAKEPYSYSGYPSQLSYDVASYLDRFQKLDEPIIQVLGTRTGEIQKQVLDPTKAKLMLKWEATKDITYGLQETFVDAWGKR